MRPPFPLSFLEVLIDIADTAGIKSQALINVRKEMESESGADGLEESVLALIWEIEDAGGEFIGPHIAG